jgi:hypothetical protein
VREERKGGRGTEKGSKVGDNIEILVMYIYFNCNFLQSERFVSSIRYFGGLGLENAREKGLGNTKIASIGTDKDVNVSALSLFTALFSFFFLLFCRY